MAIYQIDFNHTFIMTRIHVKIWHFIEKKLSHKIFLLKKHVQISKSTYSLVIRANHVVCTTIVWFFSLILFLFLRCMSFVFPCIPWLFFTIFDNRIYYIEICVISNQKSKQKKNNIKEEKKEPKTQTYHSL